MSSPQPQLQRSRFSIAWSARSVSAAVIGAIERPARVGSHTLPAGPEPARLSDCWTGGQEHSRERRQESPTTPFRPSARPPVRPHCASSFTAYPACVRRTAGVPPPPPGQSTISPPSTNTYPPNQTHQTSGLIVKRYTACSVPLTS